MSFWKGLSMLVLVTALLCCAPAEEAEMEMETEEAIEMEADNEGAYDEAYEGTYGYGAPEVDEQGDEMEESGYDTGGYTGGGGGGGG